MNSEPFKSDNCHHLKKGVKEAEAYQGMTPEGYTFGFEQLLYFLVCTEE